MRVVGGTCRGRVYELKAFSGRPTMDRAREALLNMVSHRCDLSQCSVLDLYAGTGAVGIEFASWGAEEVVCVESSARHASLIQHHVELFGLGNVRVVCQDALRFVRKQKRSFSIVFADPPYHAPELPTLVTELLKSGIVMPEGVLVVEHPTTLHLEAPANAEIRRYGQSAFTICQSEG